MLSISASHTAGDTAVTRVSLEPVRQCAPSARLAQEIRRPGRNDAYSTGHLRGTLGVKRRTIKAMGATDFDLAAGIGDQKKLADWSPERWFNLIEKEDSLVCVHIVDY